MEAFFNSVFAFIVLVGFLIWFHELGHFLFAKLFGVKVEVFSVGFGPPLIAKRWGETLYQVALIPLGGYVKLYGEDVKVDDPRAFSSKSPLQRILIAFAGPLFNIVLTVLLLTLVYSVGIETAKYTKEPAVIGYVEEGSWADKAGIRAGDRILEINGNKVEKWEDLKATVVKLAVSGKKEVSVVLERNGKRVTLKAPAPDVDSIANDLGLNPDLPPVVGRVFKNLPGLGTSPAYQVGLKEGDVILEVNGKKVSSWYEVVKLIRKSNGKPVKLKIKRGEKIFVKEVVPAVDPVTKRSVIGISPLVETVKITYSPSEALSLALERTKELTVMTFQIIGGLITGQVSAKNIGGPIAIAQFAGQAAESGLIPFLSSMAFISLQLGIFNLLPLPVLDGGLILLFLLEMIRGRPMPDKFKEYWQKVGFALIITLMVFVVINDIMRLVSR